MPIGKASGGLEAVQAARSEGHNRNIRTPKDRNRYERPTEET